MIRQSQLQMCWSFSTKVHERASIERLSLEFVEALQAILSCDWSREKSALQARDLMESDLKKRGFRMS
jgi:hypothetical protein